MSAMLSPSQMGCMQFSLLYLLLYSFSRRCFSRCNSASLRDFPLSAAENPMRGRSRFRCEVSFLLYSHFKSVFVYLFVFFFIFLYQIWKGWYLRVRKNVFPFESSNYSLQISDQRSSSTSSQKKGKWWRWEWKRWRRRREGGKWWRCNGTERREQQNGYGWLKILCLEKRGIMIFRRRTWKCYCLRLPVNGCTTQTIWSTMGSRRVARPFRVHSGMWVIISALFLS